MDRKSKNFSEKQIIDNRKKKLEELKNADLAYQNNFSRTHLTVDILNEFSNESDNEVLATKTVTVAGRMMTKRVMGKASFAHVQDSSGNSRHLINSGAVLTTDRNGIQDQAYEFGVNKYLRLENNMTASVKAISFWVYSTSKSEEQMY